MDERSHEFHKNEATKKFNDSTVNKYEFWLKKKPTYLARILEVKIIWVYEKGYISYRPRSSVYKGRGRKSHNNPPPATPLDIHNINSVLFHSFTVEILSSTREWMGWTSLTLCTETGTMMRRAGKWTLTLTWKITYVIY